MLILLDAAYPYQMSYLNHWKEAWKEAFASETQEINVVQNRQIRKFRNLIKSADIIVMLHSCTADTNLWIESVKPLLEARDCPLITFVGNEYNSPALSVERRLRNLCDIYPEIIASQLNQSSARWLYEGVGKKIISIPHGMTKPTEGTAKEIDFAYYGFKYPSYVFGSLRNKIVEDVVNSFKRRNLRIKFSYEQRLDRDEWISLMNKSRVTASTEAGSSHIFKTDEIWNWMYRAGTSISSDNLLLHSARRLPINVKQPLRKLAISLGLNYGSLEKKNQHDEDFFNRIVSNFESRDGRCISSRHLEAISSSCWQLLYRGEYSGILKPDYHYTELSSLDSRTVEESVDKALNIADSHVPWEIREELYKTHSYQARIRNLLENLV